VKNTWLALNLKKRWWCFKRDYWSQTGEDYVLSAMLTHYDLPFPQTYIDIGAADPRFGSSSYHFYREGLSGIVVDPLLDLNDWKKHRPRDLHIRKLVSDRNAKIEFFEFHPSAYSTTNVSIAESLIKSNLAKLLRKSEVEAVDWKLIFSHFPISNQGSPDFVIFMDVEGGEMELIKNFPWESFRPLAIVMEEIDVYSNTHQLREILDKHEYLRTAYTGLSSIYLDSRRLKADDKGRRT
jgi:hypothetical protein